MPRFAATFVASTRAAGTRTNRRSARRSLRRVSMRSFAAAARRSNGSVIFTASVTKGDHHQPASEVRPSRYTGCPASVKRRMSFRPRAKSADGHGTLATIS